MPKHHMLIDPTQSSPTRSKPPTSTDWDICVLCQIAADESLECPLRSPKQHVGSGYSSLVEYLIRFQTLQCMAMDISMERMNNGYGIQSTLTTHAAKWHKTCRLKFHRNAFDEQSRGELTTGQQRSTPTVHTLSANRLSESTERTCFFCNEPAGSASLHNTSTYNIDTNVRRAALDAGGTTLLTKLATGDMIAIEAKYHQNCLRSLYNRARQEAPKGNDGQESCLHGIAFAELVASLEEMNNDEDNAPVFKLIDIAQPYKVRLEQLGRTLHKRIHTARLKNRLLSALPGLKAHSQGREIRLSFEKGFGPALMVACCHYSDAMHLMRAAHVVRKEIFDSSFSFDGSFHENCHKDAVPPSLLALVNMILDGVNIKHQTQLVNTITTQSALAISQLMVFNSVYQARNVDSSNPARHSRSQETPLPLFLSFKIHAVTRSRCLVDTLLNLGLCVSYDRLLRLTSDIANGVCQRLRVEDVVCPPKLRRRLFTAGAVDNIGHNPSSSTAKESFHGTGISFIQHPSHTHGGIDRGVPVISDDGSSTKLVTPLP